MAEEDCASDPSRTADAAIQSNEVAIDPKASEEMSEEETRPDFAARCGAEATEAEANADASCREPPPPVDDQPAVVEAGDVCDQEEGAGHDLEPTLTASEIVNIVDPPTSSDEATSEATNLDIEVPPGDDDETASDSVANTAVDATIPSSPLMGDQGSNAEDSVPGDDVLSTQERLEIMQNPVVADATNAEVGTGVLTPRVDDSAVAPPLSEILAADDNGENDAILKPQQLASNSNHDAAPAEIAGKSPSTATPLQRARGDEENVGGNMATSEARRPDEENHDGDGSQSFVNRGFELWDQSRQQWLHRREAGGSRRNSDGSQFAAIPLDVVRIRLSWSRMAPVTFDDD